MEEYSTPSIYSISTRIPNSVSSFSITGNPTRIVTIPLCPDLLRYDQLGVADNLRGRVVRAFFWLMRVWPVP